jgi:uncharacterized GH25 family protein
MELQDGLLNILAESDPANDKLDFESLLGIKSSRTVELIPLEKPEDITIENTLQNREVQNVETVQNLEVEAALKSLEDSALEHQKSINELEKSTSTKTKLFRLYPS